jgi:hypothetical protein
MATHTGSEGVVKVGSVTVAEVRDFSFTDTSESIDTTPMGFSARVKKAGLLSASGSITCFWDETDATGQGALDSGASVSLVLYPEGAATGASFATIASNITEQGISSSFDGMVEATYSFESSSANAGDRAVIWATVS